MWFSPELIYAMQTQNPLATVTSGTSDPIWETWQQFSQQYQRTTNAAGMSRLDFWLVIALPKSNYSEKIEWHESLPMLMPTSGTGRLLGIAKSRSELDKMLTNDTDNVHLTYKVKIQGQQAWRNLFEFLATHDMLEKEN